MDTFNMKGMLIALEYSYIDMAMREVDNNVTRAANMLQIKRTTLVEKIRAREHRTLGGLYDLTSPYSEIKKDSQKREAPETGANLIKDDEE